MKYCHKETYSFLGFDFGVDGERGVAASGVAERKAEDKSYCEEGEKLGHCFWVWLASREIYTNNNNVDCGIMRMKR